MAARKLKTLAFQENLLYTAVIVDSGWKYRGRVVTVEDVGFIRGLIAANSGVSRRTLSKKLCEAWGWRQANGALCDMVCRGLLPMLERAGQIELPAVTYKRHKPAGPPRSTGAVLLTRHRSKEN